MCVALVSLNLHIPQTIFKPVYKEDFVVLLCTGKDVST